MQPQRLVFLVTVVGLSFFVFTVVRTINSHPAQKSNMANLEDLTRQYVAIFHAKKLDEVIGMFHANGTLKDPANVCKNHDELRALLTGLFANEISFEAVNIFVDDAKATSVIEFRLSIGDKKLQGVDLIQWKDGKIQDLRAYLY
eukprot:TRINITY_DN27259_c0_g1_i1.p1 TRINITY_DN27259_c0_g1~~TRINITY_DN27259_c0_g1_i1.p1  ORF type:complete len:144 (-),score=31.12 TRINITY_DN27259_c0_g1_i1:144-575(-)